MPFCGALTLALLLVFRCAGNEPLSSRICGQSLQRRVDPKDGFFQLVQFAWRSFFPGEQGRRDLAAEFVFNRHGDIPSGNALEELGYLEEAGILYRRCYGGVNQTLNHGELRRSIECSARSASQHDQPESKRHTRASQTSEADPLHFNQRGFQHTFL
jgi:hypothetical protein